MTLPDKARLAEIEARSNAATPGPWGIESCGEKGDGANMIGVIFDPDDLDCERPLSGWVPVARPLSGEFIDYYRDEEVAVCEHRNRNSGYDAAFIAHARFDIPWLLSQVRALVDALAASEAERERLRATLQFYADRQRWSPNSYHIISAHEDRGDRARAALAADAKEGSDETQD